MCIYFIFIGTCHICVYRTHVIQRYWIDLGCMSPLHSPPKIRQEPSPQSPGYELMGEAMDRRGKVQYLDPAVQAQHQTTHDVMAPRRFCENCENCGKMGWIMLDICTFRMVSMARMPLYLHDLQWFIIICLVVTGTWILFFHSVENVIIPTDYIQ